MPPKASSNGVVAICGHPADAFAEFESRIPNQTTEQAMSVPEYMAPVESVPFLLADSAVDVSSPPIRKKCQCITLNPLESMFHVFISYRVATDSKLSIDLHDRMQVLSTSEDAKIPFLSRAKRPKEFKPSLHAKGMNIFLDARCLSDGDEWRGDGTVRSGFVAGLLSSAVFVPILSWSRDDAGCKGSVGGLVHAAQPACEVAVEIRCPGPCIHVPICNRLFKIGCQVTFSGHNLHLLQIVEGRQYHIVHCSDSTISVSSERAGAPIEFSSSGHSFSLFLPATDDYVDNVLLELLLAQELHLAGKHHSAAIVNCGVILPVFIGDFPVLNLLSSQPSKATNIIASSILKASNLDASPDCLTRSVRDIISFFLDFQGIRLADYCPTYPSTVCSDHALNTISDRIIKRVSKYMDRGSIALLETSRPLSVETCDWLCQRGMGYYAPILAVHNISSLRQLGAIDALSFHMSSLIADAAAVSGRTNVEEALRLQAAVLDAKNDPLSQPLSTRLSQYVDVNASFLTAISSPAVIEIGLAKPQVKVFLFLCTVHNVLSIVLLPHGVRRYETAAASPIWVLSFLAVILPLALIASMLLSPLRCRWFCASLFLCGIIAAASQFFAADKGYEQCHYFSLDQSACLIYQKFSFSYCIAWFSLLIFSISRRQDLFWHSAFLPLGSHFLIYTVVAFSFARNFNVFDYWGSIEMFVLLYGLCLVPFLLRKIALNAADAFIGEDVREFEKIHARVQRRDAEAIRALDTLMNTDLSCVHDKSLYGGRSLHPCQDHSDINRLYSDAESVNTAFQDLCKSWFDDNPVAWAALCENSPSAGRAFNFKAYNPDSAQKPTVISGPVKLASRAICKIVRSYKGDAARLTDIVRCVIVFPDMNDLLYFMQLFASRGYVRQSSPSRTFSEKASRFHQYFNNRILGLPSRKSSNEENISADHAFEILRVKNRFQPSGTENSGRVVGYRDVSIKVKFGYKESPSGSVNFVPVIEWTAKSSRVRTIVTEIQLRLKDFQTIFEQKSSTHDNYVFYRDILSS